LTLADMAVEEAPSKNCQVIRQIVAAMSKGILINRAKPDKAVKRLYQAKTDEERAAVKVSLF
jgi:hypothetical protein